jgi:hypothetical protein
MKSQKWIVAAGAAASAFGILIAQAAQDTIQPHLNVKMGLWEMSSQPQVSGDMPGLSEQQLQSLTPEQRAKMQQAMQAAMAAMRQPRLTKECVTAERLARGFHTGNDDPNCKTTVVTNSASEFETHIQCSSNDGGHSVGVHFTATSAEHLVGTVNGDMSRNGQKMSYSSKLEGHWLASDCGNIKDSEVVSGPK